LISFKEKLQKNFVNFVANYGKHLIWITNIIFIILFILTNISSRLEKFSGPLFKDFLPLFLRENGSNLISLSAIFIGIYFTVFTLIITLNLNSSIAKLTQKNFKTLITFIRNAFIVTFAYVIFLLVIIGNQLDEPEKVTFTIQIINLLNCLFVIYIIMSAFRVALLLYAAYSVDLKNLNKVKTEAQEKQNKIDEFILEVQNYMDKH